MALCPFSTAFTHPRREAGDLFCFSPDAGERGLDLGFETGDEFAVGVDQHLPGFDLFATGLSGMARQPTFCFSGLQAASCRDGFEFQSNGIEDLENGCKLWIPLL